ncbi:hypothetical protein [Winogradskyella sp. 3972H.M.0a.05]|uniref:hypothetical protein n=1 Tax=Winogradskyella sp. 3972H.M.0a.05 TaxID=2950277 RepID=UPI00339B4763
MKSIKKLSLCIIASLLLLNTTCDDDDIIFFDDCDLITLIDNDVYTNGETAFFSIEDASISENCLRLSISSSGCDGSSWEFTLVDSGDIAESDPVQRFLRLKLVNPEACLAVFTRDISFDISNLQVENEMEVLLNVEGWNENLLYEY